MALHFDGDHFPRLGKFADPLGPVARDGHERAVEQHHRLAAAVDFVIHFEPVNRRIARSWFLLRRYDGRHEHCQEKSDGLHVWLLDDLDVDCPLKWSNGVPRIRQQKRTSSLACRTRPIRAVRDSQTRSHFPAASGLDRGDVLGNWHSGPPFPDDFVRRPEAPPTG